MKLLSVASLCLILSFTCFGQVKPPRSVPYDILIRNGLIYDGSGQKPYKGDVGIRADRVVAVGSLTTASGAQPKATTVIDAKGMAVTPGFINVLSHTGAYLLQDGQSMSDLKQGVTTEIFGELSWGPVKNQAMRQRINRNLATFGPAADTCT